MEEHVYNERFPKRHYYSAHDEHQPDRLCWHDGTPRLKKASVPPEYRRYVDLYHYDRWGNPIWELVIAEHEARVEHEHMAYLVKLSHMRPVGLRNPVGRNDLCPCESGLKYKKCHLIHPEAPLASQ